MHPINSDLPGTIIVAQTCVEPQTRAVFAIELPNFPE